MNMAKIENKKLIIDGYIYVKSQQKNDRIYWDCRRVRSKQCKGRAITNATAPGGVLTVYKQLDESKHEPSPNREECDAEVVIAGVKCKASDHSEQRPAQLVRAELSAIPSLVLSQLHEREALRQTVRRQRRANLPPNPNSLEDLNDLPEIYQNTLISENFLLYDFKGSQLEGRVLVYATRRNIELLCQSSV